MMKMMKQSSSVFVLLFIVLHFFGCADAFHLTRKLDRYRRMSPSMVVPSSPSKRCCRTGSPSSCLVITRSANLNSEDRDEIDWMFPSNVVLPMAVALVVVMSFLWPLLALLWSNEDLTAQFDIDMFLALKGILDHTSMGTFETIDETTELYPLGSSMEQLVSAMLRPR